MSNNGTSANRLIGAEILYHPIAEESGISDVYILIICLVLILAVSIWMMMTDDDD
jgi:hypothetical protein